MSITHLNKESFDSEVRKGKGKCVVDFSATWCGPCRMLAPILEELSEENPEIKFYGVDVDDEPELSAEFGIMSVPSVFVFEDGLEITHFIGLRPKEEIKALL